MNKTRTQVKDAVMKYLDEIGKYYENQMQTSAKKKDYENAMYYNGCAFAIMKAKIDLSREV